MCRKRVLSWASHLNSTSATKQHNWGNSGASDEALPAAVMQQAQQITMLLAATTCFFYTLALPDSKLVVSWSSLHTAKMMIDHPHLNAHAWLMLGPCHHAGHAEQEVMTDYHQADMYDTSQTTAA